jgi:hypothetical protein
MGCSIDAYYSVNKEEIEKFIQENDIDINNWKQCNIIAKHFYEKITGKKYEKEFCPLLYVYSKTEREHKLINFHSCKYIRDHESFERRDLPFHVTNCLYCITVPEDAIRVAKDLRIYYPNDEDLLHFADWLEETSKYCYKYHYSM